MIFTEDTLLVLIDWAEWRTARSLGLAEDNQLHVPDEVAAMIAASGQHQAALQRFIDAYQAWWGFHLEIEQAGKSGNMSAAENNTLIGLITERDEAKKVLLDITPI